VIPKKSSIRKQNCRVEVSLARALLAASKTANNEDGAATNKSLSTFDQMKRYMAQVSLYLCR